VLDQLAAAVVRHHTGLWSSTAVPRLSLISTEEPTPAEFPYEPKICFAAEGAKRTTAGDRTWLNPAGHMFLNSLELPVTATLDQTPYRAAVLHLDNSALAGLLLELDQTEPHPLPTREGQIAAPMTPDIVEAVTRWVRLLDTPGDIGPLAHRVEAEILYRLLNSPLGPVLRQFAISDSGLSRIRSAAGWIRTHYNEPLRIDAIAAVANMSTATLHRQFKAATGLSPIRFQKHLRLREARRQLLAGHATAAQIAAAVGYASPTQFSREYRRTYGLPPAQDAAQLRQHLAPDPGAAREWANEPNDESVA
jgi:AraC-like DNA-binding protein